MLSNTYYVYCVVPTGGKYRITVHAPDKEVARSKAEQDGHKVDKIRLMPVPPRGGRSGR